MKYHTPKGCVKGRELAGTWMASGSGTTILPTRIIDSSIAAKATKSAS